MKKNADIMDNSKGIYLILLLMGVILLFCRKEEEIKQDAHASVRNEQSSDSAVKNPVVTSECKAESIEQQISVLLTDSAQESPVHDSVFLQSDGSIIIKAGESSEYLPETLLDMSELLQEGETVTVYTNNPEKSIRILSLQRSQGVPAYEGELLITRTDNGFIIINRLDLETYLKYVVPSEMPSSYPDEALKAQAVCARTYAISQIQENRLDGYEADVDDTISFQVYNNIPRQKSTDSAVDETKGQIMMWQNMPIQAYFFSTSCGFTSSDQVWGSDTSAEYLESISVSAESVEAIASGTDIAEPGRGSVDMDKYLKNVNVRDFEAEEPWYRWSVTFPWDEIQQRAAEQFPEIGQLTNISVLARSDGGAAVAVSLVGTKGNAEIENEYHVREFFSPKGFSLIKNNGSETTNQKLLPSAYLSLEKSNDINGSCFLIVYGGGYGHGVGMSQNGAKCMAEEGRSWQEILQTFYHDITLENDFG